MQLLVGGQWQGTQIDPESLGSGEAVALICGFLQEHELQETLNAFINETGVDISRTRLVEGLTLTRIIREWKALAEQLRTDVPHGAMLQPGIQMRQNQPLDHQLIHQVQGNGMVDPTIMTAAGGNIIGLGNSTLQAASTYENGQSSVSGRQQLESVGRQGQVLVQINQQPNQLHHKQQLVQLMPIEDQTFMAPGPGPGSVPLGQGSPHWQLQLQVNQPLQQQQTAQLQLPTGIWTQPGIATLGSPLKKRGLGEGVYSSDGYDDRKVAQPQGVKVPTTTLLNSNHVISQDELYEVLMSPAAEGRELSELFNFKGSRSISTARKSAVLSLTPRQHDAMYVLAGCSDVKFLISNVSRKLRTFMDEVYGINKEAFNTWYKNRGRNPSKLQPQGVKLWTPCLKGSGTVKQTQPKRKREAEEAGDSGGGNKSAEESGQADLPSAGAGTSREGADNADDDAETEDVKPDVQRLSAHAHAAQAVQATEAEGSE